MERKQITAFLSEQLIQDRHTEAVYGGAAVL